MPHVYMQQTKNKTLKLCSRNKFEVSVKKKKQSIVLPIITFPFLKPMCLPCVCSCVHVHIHVCIYSFVCSHVFMCLCTYHGSYEKERGQLCGAVSLLSWSW